MFIADEDTFWQNKLLLLGLQRSLLQKQEWRGISDDFCVISSVDNPQSLVLEVQCHVSPRRQGEYVRANPNAQRLKRCEI